MKKAFLLFLICLCPFFLFGCVKEKEVEINSNSYQLLRLSYGQNNSFYYLFPVNSSAFSDAQIDSTLLVAYRFFLKGSVGVLRDAYSLEVENIENATVSEVQYYSNYDAVGFELKFTTLDAFHEFFGNGSSLEPYKTSGLFLSKAYYQTSFPFSKTSADAFRAISTNALNLFYETFNIDVQKQDYLSQTFENSTFTYAIISNSKTLRSENFFENDGLYFNIFEKTYDQILNGEKIEYYLQTVNRGWWYLMALCVTIGVVAVLLIAAKKREKNRGKT